MTACNWEQCPTKDFDVDTPRYDQEVYWGRVKHFFKITNPLNLLVSEKTLDRAQCIVLKLRCKERLPECLTDKEIWRAKVLYDSAFHPESGEKMNIIGRMSAQVPSNMLITGGMMTFYKTTFGVIFWQWINQSFNALVNYTNRSGDTKMSSSQLLVTYLAATGASVATALYLNKLARRFPPLIGRFVPLAAVAAANVVNVPCMRANELKYGSPVYDINNNYLGRSRVAAESGITKVVISRIMMAAPGMTLIPFVMDYLEKRGTLCRYPWLPLPLQVSLLGVCLVFATPLGCALFKQKQQISFRSLEPELQEKILKRYPNPPKLVFYNKGL